MIGNKSSLISCVEMSLTYFGRYTGLSHLYLPLWGNMPKFYQRLIKDLFAKKMKILSLHLLLKIYRTLRRNFKINI